MYVCVRYKQSDRSGMHVSDTRRMVGHVCMYVLDTRRLIGHVCRCQIQGE